jgi:hypothetical protein
MTNEQIIARLQSIEANEDHREWLGNVSCPDAARLFKLELVEQVGFEREHIELTELGRIVLAGWLERQTCDCGAVSERGHGFQCYDCESDDYDHQSDW